MSFVLSFISTIGMIGFATFLYLGIFGVINLGTGVVLAFVSLVISTIAWEKKSPHN